jgi:hypothetical protein
MRGEWVGKKEYNAGKNKGGKKEREWPDLWCSGSVSRRYFAFPLNPSLADIQLQKAFASCTFTTAGSAIGRSTTSNTSRSCSDRGK